MMRTEDRLGVRLRACLQLAIVLVLAFLPCASRVRAQSTAGAQVHITTPKEQLGFDIGDDYQLANYAQLVEYWKRLDAQSDRMIVQEIGRTAEGRPQLMAIITSPE